MFEKPLHIILWMSFELNTVGLESSSDRRKHDVRPTKGAEQPWRAAVPLVPDLDDPLNVRGHFGRSGDASPPCSSIDRHCHAQRIECRVNLPADAARASTLRAVPRPDGRIPFVEVLEIATVSQTAVPPSTRTGTSPVCP